MFGGNAAGVVTNAEGLSRQQMLNVARELNASTTVFVVGSRNTFEYQIRFFTPLTEINACGHATLALFHCLALDGRLRPKGTRLRQVATATAFAPSGKTTAQTEFEGSIPMRIMLAFKPARLRETRLSPNYVGKSLGIRANVIRQPIRIAHTGLRHLLVRLPSLNSVEQLAPQLISLSKLAERANVDAVCVFCTETKDPHSTAHLRDFTAPIGHYEEPASGTTTTALAKYLVSEGLTRLREGSNELTFEQGFEMQRPSIIRACVDFRKNRMRGISVGGYAKVTVSGEMFLD